MPYTDIFSMLSLEECYRLLKDFELFPSDVSLPQLKDMFKCLADDFVNSAKNGSLEEDSEIPKDRIKDVSKAACNSLDYYFIDLRRFTYLICLISFNLKTDNSPFEKTLFILRRMSFSKGIEKTQNQNARTL